MLHKTFAKTQLAKLPADIPGTKPLMKNSSTTGPIDPRSFFTDIFTCYLNSYNFQIYFNPPDLSTQGDDKQESTVIIVGCHGAGSSALTFACLADEIRTSTKGRAAFLAYDARGHGNTTSSTSQSDISMTIEHLADDLDGILHNVLDIKYKLSDMDFLLVGHSLGGAVVTELGGRGTYKARLLGVAVLDVVEGSAVESLHSMGSILAQRPARFIDIPAAIDWHIRTRRLRNSNSARVSVPALFAQSNDSQYTWRTDLQATKPFWQDWFTDLSRKFLSLPCGKLLILAGTDRLDKPLMIAQMQGKFQLQVFPETGHFLHEDAPDKSADALIEFWHRNDRQAILKINRLAAVQK